MNLMHAGDRTPIDSEPEEENEDEEDSGAEIELCVSCDRDLNREGQPEVSLALGLDALRCGECVSCFLARDLPEDPDEDNRD